MKYEAKRVKESSGAGRRKTLTMAGALLLAVCLMAGGTLAWLAVSRGPVTNTFTPGAALAEIQEDFTQGGSAKSNVKIHVVSTETDPRSIPVYIRVAVVPTWEHEAGGIAPLTATLGDLNIEWNLTSSGWFEHTDGYYYYKNIVEPGGTTANLINTATVKIANGYHMNLQILAEVIQTTPEAVISAWGQDVADILTN